jgi:release factor glutamine methyltransferase
MPNETPNAKKILHLHMTIQEARQQLQLKLCEIYDEREAASITALVMENITGWKKIDLIINKKTLLSTPATELLKKYTTELLLHKPVQYVLHEAWFLGMKFFVDENVLVPRPETEELVEWILEEIRSTKYEVPSPVNEGQLTMDDNTVLRPSYFVLDIGTGSGCIPIALKKKLPGATIYSCDVSKEALAIAQRNALSNDAAIHLMHLDFLNATERNRLPLFDMMVSNPPYIPLHDKKTMQPNVVDFEPHLALFVDDNDPLIFYKAIADCAKEKLNAGGKIYVEIHEDLSSAARELFSSKGFSGIEIKKDMQGKDRMIKATMLL